MAGIPQRIRIVEVLEATVGGTRKHLRQLAESLPSAEFDVRFVVATRRDPTFRDDLCEFRAAGHRVIELPMRRAIHPLYDPLCAWRLRCCLRHEPCDVLHLHSSKAGAIGRLAAMGLNCRVVYSPHCFAFLQRTPFALPHVYELVERVLARRTDLLLAVGESEGRLAVAHRLYSKERVLVLRNAVSVDKDANDAEVADNSRAIETIGFAGDLRAQKDPLTFVAAAKLLAATEPQLRFVMPDRGPLLRRVQRAVSAAGLTARVALRPAPFDPEAVFEHVDLAVLPSRWEGMPYALLEGLARGTPVVGSNIEPLREVLDRVDPRLTFAVGSPVALAAAITDFIHRPDRAAVAERAYRLVREQFELTSWRQRLREIYRRLAGRS